MTEAIGTDNQPVHAEELFPDGMTGTELDGFLNSLFEGVYFVDGSRIIQRWNLGAVKLTGFGCEEVERRCCSDNILVHVDENGTELCKHGCPLLETISDGQVREAKVFLRHKNGYRVPVQVRTAPIHNRSGRITGAVESFREVADSDAMRARMQELEQAAFVDALTGIANRRYMEAQIVRLVEEFKSGCNASTVCLLDLDRFKLANDMYGHQAGDTVLCTVTRTLQNCLRSTDIVGRWGGDEFLLLMPRTEGKAAAGILERCRVLVEQSAARYQESRIYVTLSIGAAVCAAGDSPSSLLTRADAQLYKAKQDGGNQWQLA
jgi:diguanylate cyclase (GGDEF)-like protein/PAS domain S-box-containing protein